MGEQEQFSVRVYYDDGRHQYVRRFVSAEEACRAFQYYTSSLGAGLGSTVRVIITDGSDCMVREWKSEQGVTFPPPARLDGLLCCADERLSDLSIPASHDRTLARRSDASKPKTSTNVDGRGRRKTGGKKSPRSYNARS